jgi:hypothetical protein
MRESAKARRHEGTKARRHESTKARKLKTKREGDAFVLSRLSVPEGGEFE